MDWRPFVEALGETVEFRLDGELPDDPVAADPGQLEQVLINLLKNAHESGSPPAEIGLVVRRHPGGFEIAVLDRGGGMSEAVLRNALLPFYSTKKTGTGLGLPLCREIVEAHGGRMTLANRDGGGVAVRLRLPCS